MASSLTFLVTALLLTKVNGGPKTPKIDSRIVGGEATTIQSYPYQVSIMFYDTHTCGGSIITDEHILTAAHCTEQLSSDELYVRLGSSTIDEGGEVINVAQIFQHNQYDSDTYDFDVSILKLSRKIALSTTKATIQLPSGQELVDNALGVATGWGRLSDNGPLPMELQKVNLPVISTAVCKLIYGDKLTDRMFCAGYIQGQKDTCQGDSGGPFVVSGILVGITSWGDGCGDANSPGVYTNVAYFKNYIESIISN